MGTLNKQLLHLAASQNLLPWEGVWARVLHSAAADRSLEAGVPAQREY